MSLTFFLTQKLLPTDITKNVHARTNTISLYFIVIQKTRLTYSYGGETTDTKFAPNQKFSYNFQDFS